MKVSTRRGAVATPDKPHYAGHRRRLRARFLEAGPEALADYELLELLLFLAQPRADVKPLAKALLRRFGGFAEVVSAEPERYTCKRNPGAIFNLLSKITGYRLFVRVIKPD